MLVMVTQKQRVGDNITKVITVPDTIKEESCIKNYALSFYFANFMQPGFVGFHTEIIGENEGKNPDYFTEEMLVNQAKRIVSELD